MNPTPSLIENYVWISEGITDNVVPGLDSILAYTQSKYATLTALQNTITNISNIINNIQTEINNAEITNQQELLINKELYYNNYTDYTFLTK